MKLRYQILAALLLLGVVGAHCLVFELPYSATHADIVDFDLDGDKDVILGCPVTGIDTILVFYNDGSCNFTRVDYPVYDLMKQISFVDLSGDDHPELITQGRINDIPRALYYANVNGVITDDYTIIHSFTHFPYEYISLIDADSDNDMDAVFCKRNQPSDGGSFGICRNNGQGVFTDTYVTTTDRRISTYAVGHMDGDNWCEVILCTTTGVYQYHKVQNQYQETLIDDSQWSSYYNFCFINDFNNDGFNDILLHMYTGIAGFSAPYKIKLNNGDGTYTDSDEYSFPDAACIVHISDFNGDVFPDLVYTMVIPEDPWWNNLYLVYNQHDSTFSEPLIMEFGIWDSSIVSSSDLDGNNTLDLVYAGYHVGTSTRMSILFNDGNGNFLDEPASENEDFASVPGRVIDVFPNPCQNHVCFKTGKTDSAQVSIKIYNLKGQLINTLSVPARDQVVWDLKDRHGKRVESGLYLYRVYESGRHTGTNKLIVIR